MKYCSVIYLWKGEGFTQEISQLYRNRKELLEWRGYLWTDFLEQMATESWLLVTTTPFGDVGIIAYFNSTSPNPKQPPTDPTQQLHQTNLTTLQSSRPEIYKALLIEGFTSLELRVKYTKVEL